MCHMSAHGLAPTGEHNNQGAAPDGSYNPGSPSGGELYDIDALDVESTLAAIERAKHSPMHTTPSGESEGGLLVGVKVRLSSMLVAPDRDAAATESEAFSRALETARRSGLPLAVHHANSTVELGMHQPSPPTISSFRQCFARVPGADRCPGLLRRGDIYTHCFSSQEKLDSPLHGTMTLDAQTLDPAVLAARERGVLFDVGHGNGKVSPFALRARPALSVTCPHGRGVLLDGCRGRFEEWFLAGRHLDGSARRVHPRASLRHAHVHD